MRRVLLPGVALLCSLAAAYVAEAATLERIRERGAITMGYIRDAVPFSSADADGNPKGYAVDLCREIARGIGEQNELLRRHR